MWIEGWPRQPGQLHLTLGILRDLQAFFYAQAESCSQTESTPAHLRLTYTSSSLLA